MSNNIRRISSIYLKKHQIITFTFRGMIKFLWHIVNSSCIIGFYFKNQNFIIHLG